MENNQTNFSNSTRIGRRLFVLSIGAGLTSWMAGCSHLAPVTTETVPFHYEVWQPRNPQISPHFPALAPRRIILSSSWENDDSYQANRKFNESLAAKLREQSFAEIVLPKKSLAGCQNVFETGAVDYRETVRHCRTHEANGLLITEVNSFKPFAPMSLSLSICLMNADEMVTLILTDGVWDLKDINTENRFAQFLAHHGNNSAELGIRQTNSPTSFLEFAANDLATFLATSN